MCLDWSGKKVWVRSILLCYKLHEDSTYTVILGIVIDDEAKSIIGQYKEIKNAKPKKEDIVKDDEAS